MYLWAIFFLTKIDTYRVIMGTPEQPVTTEGHMEEKANLRPMTEEERLDYLRGWLWSMERPLLLGEHPAPTDHLQGWDRLTAIEARNSNVAMLLTLYQLLPDERHRLNAEDLMIEDYPPEVIQAFADDTVVYSGGPLPASADDT